MTTGERFAPHSARKFADKYSTITSEKQFGQSFWRDFFSELVAIDDLIATGIEFEFPVRSRETQTIKFIDVLWPGVLLVEHKSAGEDFDKAEKQAREYLVALDAEKRPPVLIICDFARVRIIEVLAGTSHDFRLSDLTDNLDRLSKVFENKGIGASLVEVSADTRAAGLMANLFVEFEKAGYTGHATSVLLVRVLFLLFAEDTRMMRKAIFTDYVGESPTSGTGLGAMLAELFQVLDTPKEKRPSTLGESLVGFPYVNGGLFSETLTNFTFSATMRSALLEACAYDWSGISPAIFGSLFQSVRDAETRREMGEHFTSPANITKVIGDLFLNDFTKRMTDAWDSPTQLRRFHNDLAEYTWIDPACGSGNFLVVAYKRMRSLELKVIARLQELDGTTAIQLDGTWGLKVGLHQFHGIEIDEWSSSIARVAMFLADHQENLALEEITGAAPNRFPLVESAHIVCENALRVDWSQVAPMGTKTFIMGNPPFFGARFQNPEQKADTMAVWQGAKGAGELDFVANWYLIAARYIASYGGQAAFVSTSSITQGEQPGIIWSELTPLGMTIAFAHRTFAWQNDAQGQAAVHCVIVGITNNPPKKRRLWSYSDIKGQPMLSEVANINAFLLNAPDVVITGRSTPLSYETPRMDFGSMPNDGGYLSDIDEEEAERIRVSDQVAAKYLRRLVGGRELIHNTTRYCLWLEGADPNDIRTSPELSKRVQAVKDQRSASKREATKKLANRPTEFGEIRQPKSAYLAVPLITSHDRDYLQVAPLGPEVVANNKIGIIEHKSLDTFGIVVSRVFTVWNKAVSGRLKSDLNVSITLTYNNFPFPSLNEVQREAIERGAESVLTARSSFAYNTLADLYGQNSMPPALRRAHESLDTAVLKAFGLRPTATNEDILATLFARYDEATKGLLYETPARRGR
jgi:hypothetical protein